MTDIKFKTSLWNKVRGETYTIEVRGIKLPLNWDEAKKIYDTLDYEIKGRVARKSIENTLLEIEKKVKIELTLVDLDKLLGFLPEDE